MPVMSSVAGPEFVETKQSRRFQEFCDACRRYQYIGLCYGPPGVGKTLSARHYANWDKVIAYIKNPETSSVKLEDVLQSTTCFYTPEIVNTPKHIAESIKHLRRELYMFRHEELDRRRNAAMKEASVRENIERYEWFNANEGVRKSFAEHPRSDPTTDQVIMAYRIEEQAMSDPTTLIMIDEADRLKMTGLEQSRAIFDHGGIGLVLIGMPGLEKRLARYPQLYSRIGFVHEFKPLSQVEVGQLLRQGWLPSRVSLPGDGLIDEEGIATLIRITGGNFRLLHRMLTQIGRVLEINKLEKITPSVVEAARESLVIGTA
jgi:DNA transposition AAA+ family ATPase